MELVQNCFSWNAVGVSPAASYHANVNSIVLSENFADVSRGQVCPFVSHFGTAWQYQTDSPYCHDFDATACQADATPAFVVSETPTVAPSAVQTEPPTLVTVLVETNTSPPSVLITGTSTEIPTATRATLVPTTIPTRTGTDPTRLPTIPTPVEPFLSGGTRTVTFRLYLTVTVLLTVVIAFG